MKRIITCCFGILSWLANSALAAPGLVWHEPAHTPPDLGGTSMRAPLYEAADNGLTIYQGFVKAGGSNGNQTGGNLVYRNIPRGGPAGSWSSIPLAFHADVGGNQ